MDVRVAVVKIKDDTTLCRCYKQEKVEVTSLLDFSLVKAHIYKNENETIRRVPSHKAIL